MNDTVFVFEPNAGGFLSLVATVLLPILVGLVTQRSWSSGLKAVLLLLLAAVKTFVEAAIAASNDSVPFMIWPVLINVAVTFVIAVAVHFGLWRPTGVADRAQDSLVKG